MVDWRTPWSGINVQAINAAVISNAALKGAPAAKERLFDFIDRQAIIVGHALYNDFGALGIHHQHVVDSAKIARKAVRLGARKQWGLKALCKELLQISV